RAWAEIIGGVVIGIWSMGAGAAAERQLQRLAHWKGGPLGEELSTLVTHVPEVVIRDDGGGLWAGWSRIRSRGHQKLLRVSGALSRSLYDRALLLGWSQP